MILYFCEYTKINTQDPVPSVVIILDDDLVCEDLGIIKKV